MDNGRSVVSNKSTNNEANKSGEKRRDKFSRREQITRELIQGLERGEKKEQDDDVDNHQRERRTWLWRDVV